MAQLVKNPPAMWETWVNPWVGKIPWRRERLPTPVFWPGEFHGLYSPQDRQESDTTERLSLPLSQVVLVIKNLPANAGDIRNQEVPSLDWEDPLKKEKATHSSILAWRISWTA